MKNIPVYASYSHIVTAYGFRIARLDSTERGILVSDDEGKSLIPIGEIIAATGFRPDLFALRELRLSLDEIIECPKATARLIGRNIQNCGKVKPHGAVELQHPEKGFYIVGMKSYGRAPTFFISTGYEQVRSVVAAISGDWETANNVRAAY